MDSITALYTSVQVPDLVSALFETYRHSIMITLLIIAILNCFFGFHLRKVWGILAGMCLGALISAGICIYIERTGTILYLIVILGAFIMGLLALLLYRVGLFFIGLFLVPFIMSHILPYQKQDNLLFWAFLGILASTLTLVWERETISTVTAIVGGFSTANILMIMRQHNSPLMLLLLGLAFSIGGIFLQFQPWRPRSAWNSDEGRNRDKQRHKRRMKRLKRKKKRQHRKDAKKHGFRRRKEDAVKNRTTTEYTPYTTQPIYQAQLQRRLEPNLPRQDLPEYEPEEYDTPLSDPEDLSAIRQAISKEVADIYQEQQEELDATLDQLLEDEYRHTTRSLRR